MYNIPVRGPAFTHCAEWTPSCFLAFTYTMKHTNDSYIHIYATTLVYSGACEGKSQSILIMCSCDNKLTLLSDFILTRP